MPVDVKPKSAASVETYVSIAPAFEVRSVFEVTERGKSVGDTVLTERPNPIPYAKSHDAIAEENPSSWSRRFDLSHWGLFGAYLGGSPVGAAAGVRGFPIPDEGSDVAMLWDIRVSPKRSPAAATRSAQPTRYFLSIRRSSGDEWPLRKTSGCAIVSTYRQ
jgi:hypothetical protein